MEPSVGKQLGIAIFFWIAYFTAVYLVCKFLYNRLRGQPPTHPDAPAVVHGKTSTRMAAWEERDRRLRRAFAAVGIILMILPLLIPIVLKGLFS